MGTHHNLTASSLSVAVSDCQVLAGLDHATPVVQTSSPLAGPSWLSHCLQCPGGRSCHKCQAGVYAPKVRHPPVLVPLSYDVAEFRRRKRRNRFYMRCVLGIELALSRGQIVRAFTLTESDYAIGQGLDFGLASKKLFMKMAYDYGGAIPRYVVTHHAPGSVRLDRHVICYGEKKLDVIDLDNHWHKVYGSKLTGMERVWSPKGLAFYLGRYLQAGDEKFVKANMSPGWVFPGWWRLNLAFHRSELRYPPLEFFSHFLDLPRSQLQAEVDDYLYIFSVK